MWRGGWYVHCELAGSEWLLQVVEDTASGGAQSQDPLHLHCFQWLNLQQKKMSTFHVTCGERSQWRCSTSNLFTRRSQPMGNINLKSLAQVTRLSRSLAADNLLAYLPRSCSTDTESAKRFPGRWSPRPWRKWTPSYLPISPSVGSLPQESFYPEPGQWHPGYLKLQSWSVNLLQSTQMEKTCLTWVQMQRIGWLLGHAFLKTAVWRGSCRLLRFLGVTSTENSKIFFQLVFI